MSLAMRSILPVVLLGLAVPSRDDERKIPLGDVPKSVLDALKAKYPHAEWKNAAREQENDETIYEISIVEHGAKIDVIVNEKGEIEQTETEIAITALPRPVVDALNASHPSATIRKAERIIQFEKGKATEPSYEALIVTAARKTIEIVLTPSGKILEEEQKDGETD
jgi:hypothetical protein